MAIGPRLIDRQSEWTTAQVTVTVQFVRPSQATGAAAEREPPRSEFARCVLAFARVPETSRFADRLSQDLIEAGVDVFREPTGFAEELGRREVLLLIRSPEPSSDTPLIGQVAVRAAELGKRIVLLALGDPAAIPLPPAILFETTIDFSRNREQVEYSQALSQLLHMLRIGTKIPEFRHDVFISYYHGDDEAGWVSTFRSSLEGRVTEHLGRRVTVFSHTGLRAGEAFATEIEPTLRSSAVLVPILSPRYVTSDWCLRELTAFLKTPGAERRVVAVMKFPVEVSELPAQLQAIQFMRLFHVGLETHAPRDLEPTESEFQAKLSELAKILTDVLRTVRQTTINAG